VESLRIPACDRFASVPSEVSLAHRTDLREALSEEHNIELSCRPESDKNNKFIQTNLDLYKHPFGGQLQRFVMRSYLMNDALVFIHHLKFFHLLCDGIPSRNG
jgi:hypothetical protein